MRTTIASATFLLLGAGAVSIGAKSNITMRGSDTLFDLTRGVLAGIPPIGALPAVAACANTSGLTYNGTGSGNGAADMRNSVQEAAPMSSTLSAAQACTGLAAPLPTGGQEAEGLVIALDGLSIAVKPGNATDANCGGVAFNGTQGAKLTLTPATCTEAGCNAAGEYIPQDEKDYLRVLYFGVHGGAATTARNCNSNVRKNLVAQYKRLFQNQNNVNCTGGTCAGKPLKHAYRRDDASGTTDVFAAVIGIPGIYQGYNKKSYPTVPPATTTQQSNGFCNAGDVGADHVTKGIHLGFDDSESPSKGPNWSTLVGDSDFANLDPIRVTCEEGDEVCEGDGTNGLVQVVFPTDLHPDFNYPRELCEDGVVDLNFDAGPYPGYFGRCGDGTDSSVGGCVIGYKECGTGAPGQKTPCTIPGAANRTSGRSYLCMQRSFAGQQGYCYLGSPQGGTECRGSNNWMRNADGIMLTESSLGSARLSQGAFFRKHMNTAGDGGTGTCRLGSATAQIGCLVGSTEPCSVGFAGREATDGAGAPADGVSIKGVPPTKPNIQALVSATNATFAGRYPLSRKLYFNSIIGFGSTFNTAGDATGAGASGEERNLALCLTNASYKPYYEAKYGFIELPGASFCEDFVEFRRCSGGLRPGIKCTAASDCQGFGFVTDGTCPATAACGGVVAENDACVNNAAVGLPVGP